MRTFSKLKAFCAYPESLDRPSPRRDEAAGHGSLFHLYVQRWVEAVAAGRPFHVDGAAGPLVRGWLERMREVWTPPPRLEVEVALGLQDIAEPNYVPVVETEPHVYVPADESIRGSVRLLTAGRTDLLEAIPGLVYVDDIKTGQFYLGDPKLLRQLLGQGIAATLRAKADGFVPGIYYARLGIFDRGDGEPILRGTHEWDQAWDWVVAAAKMPATPQPGPWCLSCWEKKDCDAYPGRAEAA